MASFQDVAALAVASADLMVVQSVIGAIRAADIESHKAAGGAALLSEQVYLPRRHLTPLDEYLPRPVIHPTPRYEARPIIHPTPKIEADCSPSPTPAPPPTTNSPIQPPWKQLVWETPIPPHVTLKVVQYRTDIPHKGLLLDVFI